MQLSAKAVLASLCVAFLSGPVLAVAPGDPMPAVKVKHIKSGILDNESFKGKVTMVNFWATWCAACKTELVEMEDVFRPLMAEKDFQMAFVSLDKESEKAAEWFQSHLKEPELFLKHLYMDGGFETADKLKVDAFPMTFLIGRDGNVAYVQKGFKEGEKSTELLAKMAGDLVRAK